MICWEARDRIIPEITLELREKGVMNKETLKKIFIELTASAKESEWIEFKEARTSFHFDKLGRYFSALANEANLKAKDFGWLIFGVRDKDLKR